MSEVREYFSDEELSEKTSTSSATLACTNTGLSSGKYFVSIGTALLHLESGTAGKHTLYESGVGSTLCECIDYRAINTEDGFVGAPTMEQSVVDSLDPIETYAWGIS
jgi:hypothetical protein